MLIMNGRLKDMLNKEEDVVVLRGKLHIQLIIISDDKICFL
jgi:hypothetical protein